MSVVFDQNTYSALAAPPRKLRIGVITDPSEGTAWASKVVRDLVESGIAEIHHFTIRDVSGRTNTARRESKALSTLLFRLFETSDYRLFKRFRFRRDALARTDIGALMAELRICSQEIVLRERAAGEFELCPPRIETEALDVLIRLDGQSGDTLAHRVSLNRALARYASCGVWWLQHGDCERYSGESAQFWEMFDKNPVSGSALLAATSDSRDLHVLYRSYASTNRKSLWWSRNPVCWRASEFIIRKVRDLHRNGPLTVTSNDDRITPEELCASDSRGVPGNVSMAGFLLRHACFLLGRMLYILLYSETWFLALRQNGRETSHNRETAQVEYILPPADRRYADPFYFRKDDKLYLLFEDWPYENPKGVICCTSRDNEGVWSAPEVVLERDYHLSYPFVFEHEGEIFMLPETGGNNNVELYRARSFPNEWELDTIILKDVHEVDCTLLQRDGMYWIFSNSRTPDYPENDELNLYYSQSLRGPWLPHPMNPVVSDVRCARPAGALFYVNGELIRPAQDCSVCYGYAIHYSRVDVLTTTDYRETPVGHTLPDWIPGLLANHTINRETEWEVMDASISVPRFGPLSGLYPRPVTKDGTDIRLSRSGFQVVPACVWPEPPTIAGTHAKPLAGVRNDG